MRRVAVALDFSAASRAALGPAARWAVQLKAELVLIHQLVAIPPACGVSFDEPRADAEARLTEIARGLPTDLRTSVLALPDGTSHEFARDLRRHDIELLVLVRRVAVSGEPRHRIGFAESVYDFASCAVLLLPPEGSPEDDGPGSMPPRRAIVATVGARHLRQSLALLREMGVATHVYYSPSAVIEAAPPESCPANAPPMRVDWTPSLAIDGASIAAWAGADEEPTAADLVVIAADGDSYFDRDDIARLAVETIDRTHRPVLVVFERQRALTGHEMIRTPAPVESVPMETSEGTGRSPR